MKPPHAFAIILLAGLCSLACTETPSVNATVETDPVRGTGDSADDPCIWIHPTDPARSLVIGTDKMNGLGVYDLSGKEIQFVDDAPMTNVDLRYNFPLGGEKVALVTSGNRTRNSIAIYKVNPVTRRLENVAARDVTAGGDAYGSCMYRSSRTGRYYVFVNSRRGAIGQWELFDNGRGKVDARRVRRMKVASQPEGCVADDELGHLYVGEEDVGIWKFGAEPDDGDTRIAVDKTGEHLTADVEGLTIYYLRDGTGYLIASSQGNSTFVVYRREGDNQYISTFRVSSGRTIDDAEETDGIDVTNVALGPAFPKGLFVAHDGRNRGSKSTNFKLVPWQAIARATNPSLKIDVSWNPRAAGSN